MKAKKHYEQGIQVYVSEGDWNACITFRSEQQMHRMGQCLSDLARIGGTEVTIGEQEVDFGYPSFEQSQGEDVNRRSDEKKPGISS